MFFRLFQIGLLAFVVCLCSCTGEQRGGPRHGTTPVTGFIHVDDEPASGVTVECYPEPDSETVKYPIAATTDEEGKFSFATYVASDGLPQGKYRLIFTWEETGFARKDKLKGFYSNPLKSKHLITVEPENPLDLGLIELSTKGSM